MSRSTIVNYTIYTKNPGQLIDFISSYLETVPICDDFYITFRKED